VNVAAGIVDTTVLIHLLRNNPNAISWLAAQPTLSITPISWLEVIYGAPGRAGQARSLKLFKQFNLVYLTEEDQDWAMQQMITYRLSRGVEINDCLIASVCHRLQVPLYTDNVRDMTKLLPSSLVLKPYTP
jgi:predicted nucleic acid-binding protein